MPSTVRACLQAARSPRLPTRCQANQRAAGNAAMPRGEHPARAVTLVIAEDRLLRQGQLRSNTGMHPAGLIRRDAMAPAGSGPHHVWSPCIFCAQAPCTHSVAALLFVARHCVLHTFVSRLESVLHTARKALAAWRSAARYAPTHCSFAPSALAATTPSAANALRACG